MKQFLNNKQVQLINGGYLSNTENSPIYHEAFVNAQRRAEYVITFSKLAKGKDFKGKKADSISDLVKETQEKLAEKVTQYVSVPKAPSRPTTDKLAAEALFFVKYTKDMDKTAKVNDYLQEFNVISEFEEFGLFFEDDIVKLNKIYTIKEIVAAVESVIDLL